MLLDGYLDLVLNLLSIHATSWCTWWNMYVVLCRAVLDLVGACLTCMYSPMPIGLVICWPGGPQQAIKYLLQVAHWLGCRKVATSSMQSEYLAMYDDMQEIVLRWGVLAELDLRLSKPTLFFLDSQSAEDFALNPVYHKRSKYIEISTLIEMGSFGPASRQQIFLQRHSPKLPLTCTGGGCLAEGIKIWCWVWG